MLKTIITLAVVLGLSSTALAAEKKVPSVNPVSGLDIAIVTDTEHNITKETTNTEFGVKAGTNGLTLSLLPNYDWDNKEVDNVQLGLSYDYKVTDSFTLSPYGEYNVDTDFDEKSKVIGLRTKLSF
jgi:predicted component of type VI protein secretion system